MSVSKGKTPEAQITSFATPLQTPVGLAYMPASNTSFGAPIGVPVPSNVMYSPGSVSTMLTEMTPQSPIPMTGFSSFAHDSYAGQGNSPNGFAQPDLNQAFVPHSFTGTNGPYGSPSPGPSRQMGYLSRPFNQNRRQNAGKVPYHIAMAFRRNNPAAGHHNFVDPFNIYWGADVRTTASIFG
jgi:hypothetical protein